MKPQTLRHIAIVALSLLTAGTCLTGCGQVSAETKQKAQQALCVSAEASIQSLRAGGAGAKAVAGLVKDVAEDKQVQDAARAVSEGNADEQTVSLLTQWLTKVC